MAVKFLNLGRSVLKAVGRGGEKVSVRYNAKALNDLKSTELGALIDDVFTTYRKPSLEVTSQAASRHNLVNMITRDGDEIITNTSTMMNKNDSILNHLLSAEGCSVKTILNSKEAKELIERDNHLKSYFAEYLSKAKNPTVELATKSNGKYDIAVMTLKDGEEVLARGACSETSDKVIKYHFMDDKKLSSGFFANGTEVSQEIRLLPKDIAEKYKLAGDAVLIPRDKCFIDLRYGLNGSPYSTLKDIGKRFCYSTTGVSNRIKNAFKRLENIDAETLKLYKANMKVPKYLNEKEASDYKWYCENLFSRHSDRRIKALSEIKKLQEVSEIRMQEKVNDVIHRM